MSFVFTCPHCNQELEAEDEWIGQQASCPGCGKKITIKMKINLKIPNVVQNVIDASQLPKEKSKSDSHKGIGWKICFGVLASVALCFCVIPVKGCIRTAQQKIEIEKTIETAQKTENAEETIQILEQLMIQYPDNPYTNNIRKIIEENQQKINIKKAIETAQKAKTAEETIQILEQLMVQYPDNPYTDNIKKIIEENQQYIKTCRYVRGEIQRAKDVKTYREAFEILENVINKYPDNYYTQEAKQLLTTYKAECDKKQHGQTNIRFQCFFVRSNGQRKRHDVAIKIIKGEHRLYQSFVNLLNAEAQSKQASRNARNAKKSLEYDAFGGPEAYFNEMDAQISSLEADSKRISALKEFCSAVDDFQDKVDKVILNGGIGSYNGVGAILLTGFEMDSCLIPHNTTITIYAETKEGNYIFSWCKTINTGNKESLSIDFNTNYQCYIQ